MAFLDQGGLAFTGRALYPRYYLAGEGEPGTDNPMGPQPYARLGFYLAGPQNRSFVMPIQNRPGTFPNASDVLVLGCPQGKPYAVAIFKSPQTLETVLLPSPLPAQFTCPPVNPEGDS